MSKHHPGGEKLKLHDGQISSCKNNAAGFSAVEVCGFFIKIMERGDCAHFSLPQHNMRLVALESSSNGCLDFVCGSSQDNQESEEQVSEAGD